MSKCRVCDAGPRGQRMHKCPNSRYYIPGSDPGAEYGRDCACGGFGGDDCPLMERVNPV